MVTKFLVESNFESGKRLLQKLDEQHVKIDAALWSYNPDSEHYELIVGSGDVEATGAMPIYTEIQCILNSLPEDERVDFSDVAVTSLSTGVIANLSTKISTPSDAIESIRITDQVINREVIDDAYIYRLHVEREDPPNSGVTPADA